MRIHPPETTRANGNIRITARVETDARLPHLPETLWYEIPEAFEALIAPGMEAFVTPLVPLAMHLGEDILVAGELSPQLAYHLTRYQQIIQFTDQRWFPRAIQIVPDSFRAVRPPRAPGVGCMFSGGVDSFYTLQRHLPESQPVPAYRLTHGIFLFSFDLADYELESYHRAAQAYRQLFDQLGLTLITANYNARSFNLGGDASLRRRWAYKTYGAGLAGVGQLLSGGLGRLLIASPQTIKYLDDTSSSLPRDQCLSTEWLEIVHDGLVEDRTEKTVAIAGWAGAHHSLRVCWWDPSGVQNCGKCPKCVRTMTTLEAAGMLHHFTTFPPLRRSLIVPRLATIAGSSYLPGITRLARRQRRWDLVTLLWIARFISRLRKMAKWLVRGVVPGFEGW